MIKSYGILLPVFSLPGGHGIGDFGSSAYDFVNLLSKVKCAYWQILPLNPGTTENGYSPYFSTSAYAINPLYISLDMLHNDGLLTRNELAEIPETPVENIDYDKVRTLKMPLLTRAAQRFHPDDHYFEFCKMNQHWLNDYAMFEVLRYTTKKPWTDWDAVVRDREQSTIDNLNNIHKEAIHVQKVLQYFAMIQWKKLQAFCTEKGISIIGDMPIYVALDSTETWIDPQLFKLDNNKQPVAVSGVPPDYFSATGQLWNNPVYNWNEHKRNGFTWWIQRMRHLFSLYHIVRIDHFRGLVQYWEILAGKPTAIDGAWRDVPTYDLFDILRDTFTNFPVICEDLGIITDDVKEAIQRYSFPGMKVLQFAFGDDTLDNPYLPVNYDDNCIVYTGTHDNLPTLGWLESEATTQELQRIQNYSGFISDDPVEIVWKLIEMALESKASVAIIPLQDILTLGVTARINNPAKLHGNWQWRWDDAAYPAVDAFSRLFAMSERAGRLRSK